MAQDEASRLATLGELIATPALILDLDALEHNVRAMAEFARAKSIALRPHAKTHKSAHIGAMQLKAGAAGLSCAKLGEAEALAMAGIGPLLITTPVVGAHALRRLAALAAASKGIAVVVDHPVQLAALVASLNERAIDVFIDVDPGQHRTGVNHPRAAVELARKIARHPNLRFAGVQFFSGPSQHIASYAARREDVQRRTRLLESTVESLRSAGFAPPVITGGGTGTHEIDAQLGVINDLQVGSYVFMDDQYAACELNPQASTPFHTALMVATRVISANWPGIVTVDAGYKAATGSPLPPQILAGAPRGARYEYRGDEHGAILFDESAPPPQIGDLVMLRTPHCDPTVNLYDLYHVVRGDQLVDVWPITARGCSR